MTRHSEETIEHPGLPHGGPTRLHWHWFWFTWTWDKLLGRGGRFFNWRSHFYLRTRMANAESIYLGPILFVRPRAWLAGPARSLHPELFKD